MPLKTVDEVRTRRVSNEKLLEELWDWSHRREYTEEMKLAIVKRLRNRNVTWEMIASALGITRQAAQQNYGPKI